MYFAIELTCGVILNVYTYEHIVSKLFTILSARRVKISKTKESVDSAKIVFDSCLIVFESFR